MPDTEDIPLVLTTRVRLSLARLKRARARGIEEHIERAQKQFDDLCDQLPRSSGPKDQP